MDFTLKKYKLLLNALVAQGYSFDTFASYLINNLQLTTYNSQLVILRHDVEAHYEQALKFAQIQNELGIKGTYFFRILPKSFKPEILKQIAELGHEVGYHYDDLAQCKGDYKKALERFEKNLETLRAIAPVQTICMDGSPLSRFDNKDLWRRDTSTSLSVTDALALLSMTEGGRDEKKRDKSAAHYSPPTTHRSFHDFGIIGEPYFDIDFNKVFYLTDTGRRWDGWKTSVRDKVPQQEEWIKQGLVYHSTDMLVKAIEENRFPNQVLFTFHPQRWTDNPFHWIKELILQTAKNQVKRFLIKK